MSAYGSSLAQYQTLQKCQVHSLQTASIIKVALWLLFLFNFILEDIDLWILSFCYSFWSPTLFLLPPWTWLWPGSAFQICQLRKRRVQHAHDFCLQSSCEIHLRGRQAWCEEVGQLFCTLQLQGSLRGLRADVSESICSFHPSPFFL